MIDLAQTLLALTRQMLTSAEAENWDEVDRLQAERVVLVQTLAGLPPAGITEAEAARVTTLITESRALERQCNALAEAARTVLAGSHNKLTKGRAMRKAYGSGR